MKKIAHYSEEGKKYFIAFVTPSCARSLIAAAGHLLHWLWLSACVCVRQRSLFTGEPSVPIQSTLYLFMLLCHWPGGSYVSTWWHNSYFLYQRGEVNPSVGSTLYLNGILFLALSNEAFLQVNCTTIINYLSLWVNKLKKAFSFYWSS